MRNTVSFLNRFWRDRSGAAAEYAVILAVIGSAQVISVLLLSGALAGGAQRCYVLHQWDDLPLRG